MDIIDRFIEDLPYYRNVILKNFTNSPHEADDLLQHVAVLIIEKGDDQYIENGNLKGWIITLIRNEVVNRYRKSKKKIIIKKKDLSYQPVFDEKIDMQTIRREVFNLPYLQRKSIMLFYKGYKYREIAEKTGENIGTIKSNIFNARKHLKTVL